MGDRQAPATDDMERPEYKIYVGGLSFDSTKESISQAFSVAGEVTNVQLVYDRETQRLKGYGFVTFADEKAYLYALEKVLPRTRVVARLASASAPLQPFLQPFRGYIAVG